MEFRSAIEYASIRSATVNADDEDLKLIRDAFIAMRDSVDDPMSFSMCDYSFHAAIIKASHNEIFLEVMTSKKEEILKVLGMMNKLNDSRSWALDLHEKICHAIERRDSKVAIDLLKNNGEYNVARFKEFLN